MSTLSELVQFVADEYLLPLGLRILVAILIFYVGRLLAKALIKAFDRVMETSQLDMSLRRFLHDLLYALLLVAVAIAALDAVGVETTAVIAVLGAAGLAVGLALQGSLSNLAAGVMLVVMRPYKVGDVVVIAKHNGRVDAIRLFNTVLITDDNREITIPNGQIISAPIENLTALGQRRVDLVVTVSDPPDLAQIKQLLEDVVRADARVHVSPAPSIEVVEVSEWAVKLVLRPWTDVTAYPLVAAESMERLREALAGAKLKFSVRIAS